MTIHFYNTGALDTISGGYIYNQKVINHLRSFGHSVEYSDEVKNLGNTRNNIIDSLVLNEAFEYINTNVKNVGLIHQVDRNIDRYNDLQLIVTGASAKIDLVENFAVREQNIRIVRPGMDEDWKVKEKYSSQIRNLLCVANYLDGKGVDELITTLGNLKTYDWNLKVVGNKEFDPQYFNYIKKLVQDISLEGRVELMGSVQREEINDLMINADMLVSFSKSETYGMAIQEAIHARLPVLMYKTGAWNEFEKSGLVTVLEEYSSSILNETLKDVFEAGIDTNKFDSEINIPVRYWSTVSKEIENILKTS